jgi:hypothetical protein
VSACPKISEGNAKAKWPKIGSIILYLYLKYNFDFIVVNIDIKSLYLLFGVMKILSLCYRLMFYMQKNWHMMLIKFVILEVKKMLRVKKMLTI